MRIFAVMAVAVWAMVAPAAALAEDKTQTFTVTVPDGAPFKLTLIQGDNQTLSHSMKYRFNVEFYPVPLPRNYKVNKEAGATPMHVVALNPRQKSGEAKDPMPALGSTIDPAYAKQQIRDALQIDPHFDEVIAASDKEVRAIVFADQQANQYMLDDNLPGGKGLKTFFEDLGQIPVQEINIVDASSGREKLVPFTLANIEKVGNFAVTLYPMRHVVLNQTDDKLFGQLTIAITAEVVFDPSIAVNKPLIAGKLSTMERDSTGGELNGQGGAVSQGALLAKLSGAGLPADAFGSLRSPGYEVLGGTNVTDNGVKPVGGFAGYLKPEHPLGGFAGLTNDGGTALVVGGVLKLGPIIRPYFGAAFGSKSGSTRNNISFGVALNISDIFAGTKTPGKTTIHLVVDPAGEPAGIPSFSDSARRPAGAVFVIDATEIAESTQWAGHKEAWVDVYDGTHLLGKFRLGDKNLRVGEVATVADTLDRRTMRVWSLYAVEGQATPTHVTIRITGDTPFHWDSAAGFKTQFEVEMDGGAPHAFRNGQFHTLKLKPK
jgi:hypothetical protein